MTQAVDRLLFHEMNGLNAMGLPENAPLAPAIGLRSYFRRLPDGDRESWADLTVRCSQGMAELGQLNLRQENLLKDQMLKLRAMPSGRWLWVGGTEWLETPDNYSGAFNCTSTVITDWDAFGLLMGLAMMGSGTGAVLERKYVSQLPPINNRLELAISGKPGDAKKAAGSDGFMAPEYTIVERHEVDEHHYVRIAVGDSRDGWCRAYQTLMELASSERVPSGFINVDVDVSYVREAGEPLKGFGGVANPIKLPAMFENVAAVLNDAVGRQLNSLEACLLIDHGAIAVVAGNVRRSAGMRQFDFDDPDARNAKAGLWSFDSVSGQWVVDLKKDALRMANHTLTLHRKPGYWECLEMVKEQFNSGEGAIMYVAEANARGNADLLPTPESKELFIQSYDSGKILEWFEDHYPQIPFEQIVHRISRYGVNPCGEINGHDLHCNLSEVHLNRIDPKDYQAQVDAFEAAALSVASLLQRNFTLDERYKVSRDLDPIVAVSFTGLFDFFVHAFGIDWLRWWEAGRPAEWGPQVFYDTGEPFVPTSTDPRMILKAPLLQSQFFLEQEANYLNSWRQTVERVIRAYCDEHGLKTPNRFTTVQPAGSKSLLTNASPGWHPPKAQRFIRRMTFARDSEVALALRDYGYNIVPGQADKDETGALLNDPFDPRCTEWLVEFPVEVSWANLPGAEDIHIEKFSGLAQFDFYMQVQKHYTRFNTSGTIEIYEHEIEDMARRIYDAIRLNEGYVSVTLLARLDAPYPRLPFERIDRATYKQLHQEVLDRRQANGCTSVLEALKVYDQGKEVSPEDAACTSQVCEMRAAEPGDPQPQANGFYFDPIADDAEGNPN